MKGEKDISTTRVRKGVASLTGRKGTRMRLEDWSECVYRNGSVCLVVGGGEFNENVVCGSLNFRFFFFSFFLLLSLPFQGSLFIS